VALLEQEQLTQAQQPHSTVDSSKQVLEEELAKAEPESTGKRYGRNWRWHCWNKSNSLKLNNPTALSIVRSKGVEEEMGKAEPESTGKRYGRNWRWHC
jgi:ABC-type antimicrobial peptide transport system ATPase subunit